MRRMVFLGALAFGCSDNALPVDNSGPTTATNGSSTAGTNGSTTAGTNGSTTAGTNGSTTAGTNGSTTAGTNGTNGTNGTTGTSTGGTTGGPAGSPCMTACDCVAGLACFQGKCIQAPMGNLYCCDSSDCPSGMLCQSSAGAITQCGSGTNTTGMGGGCKTACDCPSGQACFMGGCIQPPTGALYCCDSCPSAGGFCQATDGSFMMCGGGMTGGGPRDAGVSTMCTATMCMNDADCMMAGCNNGCNRNRRTCR